MCGPVTRRRLVILAVLAILALGGCTTFGGATSEAGLTEDAGYDWGTEADVEYDLAAGEYTAVYAIENRSSISIYQTTRYGTEDPIGIRAVQFRHPNGTVVNASEIGVSEDRSSVDLDLPADEGQLAFTASKRSKEFVIPVFVEGSHTVKVPADHRVENFVLGTVSPRGYETETVGDRVFVRWGDLASGSIRVEYYLARDVYLFAGLIGMAAIAGVLGIGFVYRQIQQLRREREALGLDVETGDDGGKGPPPGMR